MERATPKARSVRVTAGELPGGATALVDAVRAAATRCGGREIKIVALEGERSLTVDFVVDAHDDGIARELGRSVLDAIDAESFSWSVAVLTPFHA